ncbi:hypothetical protein HPB48_025057 [Haemaphysalis longicornis]|uniref:Uncharacterized protein n=1 Tax=Haemaphysalis longicornis TaxID=44386 RepID=A0A9J6H988_HAELO|nr:hypothetical protein HPB48_025057 [Haemaphysalis longicornis]
MALPPCRHDKEVSILTHGHVRRLLSLSQARPSTAAPVGPLQELGRLGASGSWVGKPWLSKPLFRFLYHQRGDVRQALELANAACAGQQRGDRSGSGDCCGWWALQRGRCFLRLGMLRDAENQFRRAAEAGDPLPRAHLWLARVGGCSSACTDC